VRRNPLSISVAPAVRMVDKRYFDLSGTVELMQRLWQESIVDGFEVQNLAEWDAETPPRDEREKRFAAWNESNKYTIQELADRLREPGLPVLSVHANRDVGICLCSDHEDDGDRGRRLIHESLYLADRLGATVCVFHLWDTWKETFDPGELQRALYDIAPCYPNVKAAVENVPTHMEGFTPLDLAKRFRWITLDLRWAALYDELDRFEELRDRIANVHLRGTLVGDGWVLERAPFGLCEALEIIRGEWGYTGPLTMEPEGLGDGSWNSFVKAMSSLNIDRARSDGGQRAGAAMM
jgi:sugar phosphate isomerase/epimerase